MTSFRNLSLILTVLALALAAGCTKPQQKADETPVPTAPSADENTLGDSDSGRAMGLQTVHFPYDSSTLDGEAKGLLKANAQIMKDKTSVKVQIEGHCDARGGIQYNIALGEKRANSVRKYLVDLGVSGERVTTISYGKERPIDNGSSEEAYAKNRRANFAVTSR